ncbi:hypothetical protein GTA08_BOTSDO00648 [Botryosphaeria dothidea]|uniref:Uncharacterized protein n=1 Tax=Botryosphaeria dothidea TaxID=55169 RepID=A0A8H4J5D4_9PEZI|nr:hypothetical protein GTA08_BOTSDO00648 [Botryosphaeria dothidea]
MEADAFTEDDLPPRNVRFEEVTTDTVSPSVSIEPPASSQRYAPDWEATRFEEDGESSQVDSNINFEPNLHQFPRGIEVHPARYVPIGRTEYSHMRRDPDGNMDDSYQRGSLPGPRNPQANGSEVITISDDDSHSNSTEEEQVPFVTSSQNPRQNRHLTEHRSQQQLPRQLVQDRFGERDSRSYYTNGQGYVTDVDHQQKRYKDRPRGQLHRGGRDKTKALAYTQTDDESLMRNIPRHMNDDETISDGIRLSKRSHSPENHLPSLRATKRQHVRTEINNDNNPEGSHSRPLKHQMSSSKISTQQSDKVSYPRRIQSSSQVGPRAQAFMDEDSDEDPWPLPDKNLAVKRVVDEKASLDRAQQGDSYSPKKLNSLFKSSLTSQSVNDRELPGRSATQYFRPRPGETKSSKSLEGNVEMFDLTGGATGSAGMRLPPANASGYRTSFPKLARTITRVTDSPVPPSLGSSSRLAASSPASSTSTNFKPSQRQLLDEAARRIRESNTEEEYTRASISATPQPKKRYIKLTQPKRPPSKPSLLTLSRPQPASDPRDPIEISSAQVSSDDTDTDDSDGNDAPNINRSRSNAPSNNQKTKPTREVESRSNEPNEGPSTDIATAGIGGAIRKPTTRRERNTNAAIIRRALREQDRRDALAAKKALAQPSKPDAAKTKSSEDKGDEESAWKQAMTAIDGMRKSPALQPRRPNPVGHGKDNGGSTTIVGADENHSSSDDESGVEQDDPFKLLEEEKRREEAKKKVARDKKSLARAKARQAKLEAEIEATQKLAKGIQVHTADSEAEKVQRGAAAKNKAGQRKKRAESLGPKSSEFVGEDPDHEDFEDGTNEGMDGQDFLDNANVGLDQNEDMEAEMAQTEEDHFEADEQLEQDADGELDDLFNEPEPAENHDRNPAEGSDTSAGQEQDSQLKLANGNENEAEKAKTTDAKPGVRGGEQGVGSINEDEEAGKGHEIRVVRRDEATQNTNADSITQSVSTAPTSPETSRFTAFPEPAGTSSGGENALDKGQPSILQAALANVTRGPSKDQSNSRPEVRKPPPASAREAAQRNAARREQALAKGPLKKTSESLDQLLGTQSSGSKKGKTVNGVSHEGKPARPAGRPKNSALMPAHKPKSQISSGTHRKADRLPREESLMSPKATKKNGVMVAQGPVRKPDTVLNNPDSTDFGLLVEKTPSTPSSLITEDDKKIHYWKEKGLKWDEIRTLYAALTGKKFTKAGLQGRLKRVLACWPELKKEKESKEPMGLAALVAEKEAEKEAEEEDAPQPPQLGGKKWDPNAYEQYMANQQALADFLTDGEESEDDYEGSEDEKSSPTMVTRTVIEPEPLDENEVWFQYHVNRKYWTADSPEDQADEIRIGLAAYNTLVEANTAAGKEIQLTRFGIPGASAQCSSFTCNRDENGMQHYRAESALGIVLVYVSRSLRSPLSPESVERRPTVTSAQNSWLSKRHWIARSKEIHITTTYTAVPGLPSGPEDEAGIDALFEESSEPRYAQSQHRHESNHRLIGAYTVRDLANREAGRALLEACAPKGASINAAVERAEMQRVIYSQVDELEVEGELFTASGELPGSGGGDGEAPVEVVVWVEECVLGGPRNI